MSEELRPLGAYTADELVAELRRRVTVGVYVVMAGDPSAAEEFRAKKVAMDGRTPINDFLFTCSGSDREELEELHRCAAFALGHRVALFKMSYGVPPRYMGADS